MPAFNRTFTNAHEDFVSNATDPEAIMDGEAPPHGAGHTRGERLIRELFGDRPPPLDLYTPSQADPGPDFLDAEMLEAFHAGSPIDVDFAAFRIVYADANGVTTERTIEPRAAIRTIGGREIFLRAHCRMRDGNRFFRSSRIESLINLTDGHYVGRQGVGRYLSGLLESSRNYRIHRAAVTPLGVDRMRCLLWVARADGHVSRSQRQALQEVLLAEAGISNARPFDRARCDIEIDSVTVDRSAMRLARSRLAERGELDGVVHIARMVADLAGVRSERLERAMLEIGGARGG